MTDDRSERCGRRADRWDAHGGSLEILDVALRIVEDTRLERRDADVPGGDRPQVILGIQERDAVDTLGNRVERVWQLHLAMEREPEIGIATHHLGKRASDDLEVGIVRSRPGPVTDHDTAMRSPWSACDLAGDGER